MNNNLNTSRRFVIPDIHGCCKTFKKLIKKIKLQKTDKLYLLGDYIDRGPDSAGVVDYILSLQKNNFQVFPLRGNHEQDILNASREYEPDFFRHYVSRITKSLSLLNSENQIIPRFRNFFEALPFYFLLHDFILVHAGLNCHAKAPFKDYLTILESRTIIPDPKITGNRIIIHGHQVTYLDEIKKAIENKSPVIPLDNGCVYTKKHKIYDYTKTGNLCSLNLDNFELIIQPNIEEEQ